mmetsp:Transcript_42279/g.92257  ORF Transcript_42279/g.92257 Transcript_42279/m.92257 type:complete len:239 (-) Transcript_42279:159-875(-)|eukprot:CAMPEP_0204273462 /NCGR_PEP_ID=MMETSP0468-20130131/23439_1 /ASSEMBLY_ACC=CAM_ASM_000383 /TAXON_ID=2969 /ORGANISM="Oxyrrhis marina" /LENGTH=238 /DNA_ID=CAMNT_0051249497 /DNA_START=161 /DNA_END=877 /DNA_ORIENTATION=-
MYKVFTVLLLPAGAARQAPHVGATEGLSLMETGVQYSRSRDTPCLTPDEAKQYSAALVGVVSGLSQAEAVALDASPELAGDLAALREAIGNLVRFLNTDHRSSLRDMTLVTEGVAVASAISGGQNASNITKMGPAAWRKQIMDLANRVVRLSLRTRTGESDCLVENAVARQLAEAAAGVTVLAQQKPVRRRSRPVLEWCTNIGLVGCLVLILMFVAAVKGKETEKSLRTGSGGMVSLV